MLIQNIQFATLSWFDLDQILVTFDCQTDDVTFNSSCVRAANCFYYTQE